MIVDNEKFYHKNKRYEIRVTKNQGRFEARAYSTDSQKMANGYIYILDGKEIGLKDWDPNLNVCRRLIESAKADVTSEIWEDVLKARTKN